MIPPRFDPWLVAAALGGIVYPPLVYFGLTSVPPVAIAALGLCLLSVRFLCARRLADAGRWSAAFAAAIAILAGILFVSPDLAVKAYPVLVSLAVAAVFGVSLIAPPSAIERIARLREPDLPPEGVAYTRKLTGIWVVFLLANAAISAATGIWTSLAVWTLWNGLLAYVAMGALFAGEIVYRAFVRRPSL
ncbi:MAG: hypothetical protein HY059_02200 [Proteobacteria bacterium]|nr:hypothetical protein [Pseudomonadota bacterium]